MQLFPYQRSNIFANVATYYNDERGVWNEHLSSSDSHIDLILVHDALTVHQLTEDLQLAHFNLSPGKHIVTFIEVCLYCESTVSGL